MNAHPKKVKLAARLVGSSVGRHHNLLSALSSSRAFSVRDAHVGKRKKAKMVVVDLKFCPEGGAPTDPAERPVIIIGQLRHLQKVSFDRVRSKLEPRVTEEVSQGSRVRTTYCTYIHMYSM